MTELRTSIDAVTIEQVISGGLHEFLDGIQIQLLAVGSALAQDFFGTAVPDLDPPAPEFHRAEIALACSSMDASNRTKISGGNATTRQVFFALTETCCPYLPARRERKLLTEIHGPNGQRAYNLLSRAGFRRSHNFAYRPACTGCKACVPVRVRARQFTASCSMRRVIRLNRDLTIEDRAAQATGEQFRLFTRYLAARHGDGEMAGMTFSDYRAMVEETRLDTRVTEFRDRDRRLVAACLADWLDDGPSAVYSFFAPELSHLSLGTLMVLRLIETARAEDLDYVYLGYWIEQAPKMAYKARFRPLEGLGANGWRVVSG